MVDGSEAKEVVMSYPITAKNYPPAVEQLKKRYGRERMLLKVYVRDLIRLVIDFATHGKISLSTLYVKLSAQLRALGTLGVTTDKCAAVIYPLVESCLPEEVLRAWQRDPSYKDAQEKDGEEELKLLISFLEREVGAEDNIKLACEGLTDDSKSSKEKSKSRKSAVPTANSLVAVQGDKKQNVCLFCGKAHQTSECGQGEKLTYEEKKKKLDEARACFSCLKVNHHSKKCKQFVKCLVCARKHSTIMCQELPHHRPSVTTEGNKKEEKVDGGSATTSMANEVHSPEVLMQTLVVEVQGTHKTCRARVLVVTGSQKSYITRKLAEEVGLSKIEEEQVRHVLFGGVHTKPTSHDRYNLVLRKLDGSFTCDFDVSDVPVISGSISAIPTGPWIQELKKNNIVVSDYSHGLTEVGVLIGADVAAKLITGEKVELSSGPVAINTLLGWTVMGKVQSQTLTLINTPVTVSTLSNLDVELPKLWELEVIGISESSESKSRKELEEAALQHFTSTVSRTEEGRYEVHLPWIEGHSMLPSNRSVAERRLISATEKMKKEDIFLTYDKELKKWEAAGKIEEVPEFEWNNFGHYLPHRAVVKVGSTTPVRPVFDASCKLKGHPSLNDCLEKGPNMLEKIPAILTKIRMHEIGFVADIEKAFQQISITSKDRDYLRFLWWTDSTCTQVKVYRHTRVVFGVTASPFLLAASLRHIADHSPEELKITGNSFVECTYVDNLAMSVSSLEEFEKVKSECDKLLLPAKFNLRGWECGPTREEKIVPVLGLLWNTKEDSLHLDLAAFMKRTDGPITKRGILSLVHMVFDSIGISSPVTLVPKQMLQEAWSLKISWDAELPAEMAKNFVKWKESIIKLQELKFPRKINPFGLKKEDWELHMFADASQNAYAAVVYLRSVKDGQAAMQLIQAKSRIKPIGKVTIPRMELLACLIGSRLVTSVISSLGMSDVNVFYWTDSSTAYHWITSEGAWGVFVQRRVNEIRSLSTVQNWRHVSGDLNPADLPSRGCTATQLLQSKWWEGPQWLYSQEAQWPKSEVTLEFQEINQERSKTVVSSLAAKEDPTMEHVHSLMSYVEMVKYIHKFVLKGEHGDLSSSDFNRAEEVLLRLVQGWNFSGITDARLKKLPVKCDENGILKLKTRLIHGDFSEEFKYPILMPENSPVTMALIRHEHNLNSHAGVSTLLSIMREKFWIVKGRRTIRAALRTCQSCQRFSVKGLSPPTPALPKERVQASSPYQITGLDYFGPLILRNGRKSWVALFTCAVFRAIHLELVPSLTTEDFLNAFRKFVSRRGRPQIMYSDNGTNFTGCENAFKTVNWKKIAKYGCFQRIEWRFNPPTASWYGGWFERLVGVVKQTLRKVLGNTSLNQEELATILCEVEAVVNHRPLTYVSEDGDELVPLTPQFFLSGSKNTFLPEAVVLDQKRLNRSWKHMQQISEHLRSRFRKEYLGQLAHMKGKEESRILKVGDVVLIGHDNQKRVNWPVGKITQTIPGKDGRIRVVRVKTEIGELLRPVQRIYPLEFEDSEDGKAEEELKEKSCGPTNENDKRVEGETRSGRKVKIPERFTFVYL